MYLLSHRSEPRDCRVKALPILERGAKHIIVYSATLLDCVREHLPARTEDVPPRTVRPDILRKSPDIRHSLDRIDQSRTGWGSAWLF